MLTKPREREGRLCDAKCHLKTEKMGRGHEGPHAARELDLYLLMFLAAGRHGGSSILKRPVCHHGRLGWIQKPSEESTRRDASLDVGVGVVGREKGRI